MEIQTTLGVELQVETHYQQRYSNPAGGEFVHAYKITLFNHNHYPVQLLRRVWIISDSNSDVRTVEGEGVVGRQPIIYPNDVYTYVSGCSLVTPIGKMEGLYIFENKNTGKEFEVKIPVFKLVAPSILN